MVLKFLNPIFFYSNILLPITVLVIYCVTFTLALPQFISEGVNYFFVSRLLKFAVGLLVGACAFYLMMRKLKKLEGERIVFKYSIHIFSKSDFFLLLLPLTPIVQYIIKNQDILSLVDSLFVFTFFGIFTGLLVFIIPMFLGNPNSTRIMMLLSTALVFTITCMPLVTQYFSWFTKGSFKIQLILFGGGFIASWYLYTFKLKMVLFIIISALFLGNSANQLLSQKKAMDVISQPISENKLLLAVDNKKPFITPNIYLLVYDSYVSNETMRAYGIDNSSQEEYLRKLGFHLYPHVYTIGESTIQSMSRVFNVSVGYYGNIRRGISGDGVAQKILTSLGYKTYGLFPSDYEFRGVGSSYDYSLPARYGKPSKLLISSIFFGEFRFDFDVDQEPHDHFVENKQKIFKQVISHKAFIYMHTDLPAHSQNSGVCLVNEVDLYKERLIRANLEMQQDVLSITESDPQAIIIVAGDHGPYLTKNCVGTLRQYDISSITRLDIQDRFGTFLAIKWPTTNDFTVYDEIIVLQDLFPAIFAYIFNDVNILDSKLNPEIINVNMISQASVKNGVIYGGIDSGEPLFLSSR